MHVRMRRGPFGPFMSIAVTCGAAALLALPAGEAGAGWSLRFGSSSAKPEQKAGTGADGEKAGKDAARDTRTVPETHAETPRRTIESPEPAERTVGSAQTGAKPPEAVAQDEPVARPAPQAQAGPASAGQAASEAIDKSAERAAVDAPAAVQPAAPPAVGPKKAAEMPARKPQAVETITSVTYSKKRKRTGGEATPSAQTAPLDGNGTAPEESSVRCVAGCSGSPGQVVHRQLGGEQRQGGLIPTSSSTKQGGDAGGGSTRILCVAGCYDAPKSYEAVPPPAGHGARRGEVMAGGDAGSGRLVPTAGQAPAVRAGSGDWMARINRERAGN